MDSENVKERLNSLLQKKLSGQQEKDVGKDGKVNENSVEEMSVSPQISDKRNILEKSDSSSSENGSNGTSEEGNEDFIMNQRILYDILNEKKARLLKNSEVMTFLQKGMKSNE